MVELVRAKERHEMLFLIVKSSLIMCLFGLETADMRHTPQIFATAIVKLR